MRASSTRPTLFIGLLLLAGSGHAALSGAEADALLVSHNQVRGTVSPAAAKMARLVWDPALATVAQNWADQCNWSHNANRNAAYASLSSNTGQVGENIFVTTGSRASALTGAGSAMTLWAAEKIDYTFATNSCAPGAVCGHYTQIAWANTRRVGCAVTQCPTMAGLPGFNNAQFVVCDYNPAGNFIGQSPYTAGVAGSTCPPELPNVVDGLCSPAAAATALARKVPALSALCMALLALILAVVGARRPMLAPIRKD